MEAPRGFIALTSVLVISAVLLVLITGGSLAGFYARMNALRDEAKERSYALALACVQKTLLTLANDSMYAGDATTTISDGACYTGPVTKTGGFLSSGTYSFRTRAYVSGSYTSLSVVADSDLSMKSLTEVATFY